MSTPEPQDSGDRRPWEEPGAVRRDVEPHRSPLLLMLCTAALFVGFLSFPVAALGAALGVPSGPPLAPVWGPAVGGIAALSGVAFPGSVVYLAAQDLRRMRHGLMDPTGWADAWVVVVLASIGMAVGFASVAAFTLILVSGCVGRDL
jgi:hypothetical protein